MNVQICQKCGKHNVVLSTPLQECIFCGSTDLSEIMNYDQASTANKSSGMMWILLLVVVLGLAIGGFFAWQQMNGSEITNMSLNKEAKVVNENLVENNNEVKSKTLDSEVNSNIEQLDPSNENVEVVVASESELKTQEIVQAEIGDRGANKLEILPSSTIQESDAEKSNLTENSGTLEDAIVNKVDTESPVTETKVNTINDKTSSASNQLAEDNAVNTNEIGAKNNELSLKAVDKPKTIKVQPENVGSQPKVKSLAKSEVKTIAKSVPKTAPKPKLVKDNTPKTEVKKVEKTVVENSLSPQQENQQRNALRVSDFNRGVVTDKKTGLMWMTCAVGQDWNGKSCNGEAEELFWTEAIESAKQFDYAGYSDWKLPTRQQLNSIVSCTNGRTEVRLDDKGKTVVENGKRLNGQCLPGYSQPTIDSNVFSNTAAGFFWSSSHSSVNNYSVWGVFFNKGYQLKFNKTNMGYVRLVRKLN